MILFYLDREDSPAIELYKDLKTNVGLPVSCLFHHKVIGASKLTAVNPDQTVITNIQTEDNETPVNIKDIKICFFSQYPYVHSGLLPFEEELDKLYALQEWNATLEAIFLTQKHIRYLNPLWGKYNLATEMEHIMLYQEFGIATVEMLLTNTPDDAREYYEKSGKEVIYKSVRGGYDSSGRMTTSDLTRLNKLHLSPAIFQKAHMGCEIMICLVGNRFLAKKTTMEAANVVYKDFEISKDLKEKLIQLSKHINVPWIIYSIIYDEFIDEYKAYSINPSPGYDLCIQIFGEDFNKLLRQYFIEEYNK
jgi:hypothetical protein